MVEIDTRYSFTAQFLCGSAVFARRCGQIEDAHDVKPQLMPNDDILTEHRGLVTAVIMQTVAAIESESHELTAHGPGHHLGGDHTDKAALAFLAPLAETIARQEILTRYRMILHLLRKPPMDEGRQPWQDVSTLVKARNELVHYKSQWGDDMEGKNLFGRLKGLNLPRPKFQPPNMNYFPHQFLSAATARWAVRTAVTFLNSFYAHLGVEGVLQRHMERLKDM